jgi:F0F1-type ATP synthase assembly protein I
MYLDGVYVQLLRSAILNPIAFKVVVVQTILVVMFALFALVWQGQQPSLSAFCGGLTVVLGNIAYAFVARPHKVSRVSGNQVLVRHVLAEVAKILITLSLLLGAFGSNKFDAVWLIAAVGVALLGHAMSLLIVKTN